MTLWRRSGRHSGRVLALIVGIATLGALGGLAASGLPDARPDRSWPELVGWLIALTVAGSFSITYHYQGQSDSLDHFEVVLAPAIFFLPGAELLAMVAVAKLVSQLVQRVAPLKAAFNIVQWSTAAATGSLIFVALHPASAARPADLLPLGLAMVAVALVNSCCLGLVLRRPGSSRWRSWVGQPIAALVRSTAVPWAASVALGLLAVCTLAWAPWATPLLVVPLAMLHWADKGYAAERAERGRLAGMQGATAALASPTNPRSGLPGFVKAIGRTLEWERVELVVADRSGPTLYAWPERDSVGAPPLAQASRFTGVLVAAEQALRVDSRTGDPWLQDSLAADGWRDGVGSSVSIGPRTVGALCLYNRRQPTALPNRDLLLVENLTREVATAVEKAELLEAIVDERAKLLQIVTEATDGIATLDVDGQVKSWNPAFERVTGYPREAVLGSRGLDLLHPLDRAGRPVDYGGWATRPEDPPENIEVRAKDGNRFCLSCSYARGLDEHGSPDRLIMMVRDVTALNRAEAVLAGQAGIFELIARGAPLGQALDMLAETLTSITDATDCVVLLSGADGTRPRAVAAAGGGSGAVVAGIGLRPVADVGWLDDSADSEASGLVDIESSHLWQWLRDATPAQRFRACETVPIRAAGGERLGAVLMLSAELPRPGWGLGREQLVRMTDLAAIAIERAEAEERLIHQATHDDLTGLPNRVVFLDRCEHALAQTRRSATYVTVLFLDVDSFKFVNDSLGHEAGDQLLVGVGERCREALRPGDTVARFGGDEFAILCVGISDERHMWSVAQRVRSVLAAPFSVHGTEVFVTVSIGLVLSNGANHANALLDNADAAMYRAKQAGGNRTEMFANAMRVRSSRDLSTQSDLHRALARDELVLYYMPTVSVGTGAVTGVEALLRWQHPQRGLLAPHDFLPLAESSGLIVQIGEKVLDLACRQAVLWRHCGPHGRPLEMAINLSARQFSQANLAETVARALNDSAVDPGTVLLEITESALMNDWEASAAIMHQLKSFGLRLAIDDFGTGYSSLSYLRRFPVDELKVDRSFISSYDGGTDDAANAAIVATVVNLAHSLHLTAAAEGVETAGQLERLRELSFDRAQGFYLGRPRPFDQLAIAPHW
ncbi:MAG: EAL domain-containing protein [Actinomycetota bacterium]|nr:EAL domain-containing protein [Actinomycetota bacterium]